MAGAASSATGGRIATVINRQVRALYSTVSTWSNTQKFVMSLRIQFFALQQGDDVRKNIKSLLHCVYPIFDIKIPMIIRAPNNYDYSHTKCIAIKIGNWFKTPPIFLVRNLNVRFSKETVKGGNPLFAEAGIQLESYRMMEADEMTMFLTGNFAGGNINAPDTATPGVT